MLCETHLERGIEVEGKPRGILGILCDACYQGKPVFPEERIGIYRGPMPEVDHRIDWAFKTHPKAA